MDYSNPRKHGFTLIELLVVIAIIGTLASVVLASLNSARDQARAAALKSEAREMAKLFELNMLEYGTYTQLNEVGWDNCDSFTGSFAASAEQICESVLSKQNARIHIGIPNSMDDNTVYSIMVRLPDNNYYCIGSSGATYEGPASGWSGSGCYNNP